jgi:hypothetical protein
VRIISTIRGAWGLAKRRWRVWRGRLRRDRAALALAVMLSLALFEPLLCIVSCQFWMPSMLNDGASGQHDHHMHMEMAGADLMPIPMHAADVVIAHEAAPAAGCTMHIGDPSEPPLPSAPSPIHETLLTLALPLFIVLLAVIYLALPLTGPPRVFVSVPLRPPIPIAG